MYATTDIKDLVTISFPNDETVVDLYVYEDSLYALCTRMNDDGEYVVSVWKNKASEAKEFVELFMCVSASNYDFARRSALP